jgi:transposase
VIEASTDSEWVARCLEGLGHEVIVADPNFKEIGEISREDLAK